MYGIEQEIFKTCKSNEEQEVLIFRVDFKYSLFEHVIMISMILLFICDNQKSNGNINISYFSLGMQSADPLSVSDIHKSQKYTAVS